MRHHNKNKKFGRKIGQRAALMRSLAVALVKEEKIKTTEEKSKALRPFVERLITNGKKQTLAARRDLTSQIGVMGAKKIFTVISPKYKDRNGGYVRITKLPRRESDGAREAIIEFV